MLGRIGGQAFRCAVRRPVARRNLCERKFSAYSTSSTSSGTHAPSAASPLGSITAELDRVAPCFEVPASRITILDSPASFYSTLKVRLRGYRPWELDSSELIDRKRRTKSATLAGASTFRRCTSAKQSMSSSRPWTRPCRITPISKYPF